MTALFSDYSPTDIATIIGSLTAFLGLLIPVFQYIGVRKSENRRHSFESYHKLIGDLVDPPTPRLDRQIAVVYELKNLKDYYPVSVRILKNVDRAWKSEDRDELRPIFHEIELTLRFIEEKLKLTQKCGFCRIIYTIRNYF